MAINPSRDGIGGVRALSWPLLRGALAALAACLVFPSLASAQAAPEKTDMSPAWAVSMFAAQAGDLISTEIAEAHGVHESMALMKYRAVRYTWKVGLPIVAYVVSKHRPRKQANHTALFYVAVGAGMTGVNVTLVKVWGK